MRILSEKLIVLDRGDELISSLEEFAKEKDLAGASIQAIGGAAQVTVGFYDIKTQSYIWQDYDEALEVLSLSGNLSWVDGGPFWHIHGVFSGVDFAAFGGHVKKLVVGLTLEIQITPSNVRLTRVKETETGLSLLEKLD